MNSVNLTLETITFHEYISSSQTRSNIKKKYSIIYFKLE